MTLAGGSFESLRPRWLGLGFLHCAFCLAGDGKGVVLDDLEEGWRRKRVNEAFVCILFM
jgi:hypothetical protein